MASVALLSLKIISENKIFKEISVSITAHAPLKLSGNLMYKPFTYFLKSKPHSLWLHKIRKDCCSKYFTQCYSNPF